MDAVSEVKGRLSVEDVVSEYVQLKRAGKNLKGLSPFTNEKTPSFVVSPEKQIWHDFSSNRGGDMFTFIQEVEGLDFRDSLELLARKAGVDLEKYKSASKRGGGPDKERLYEILEAATKFYQIKFSQNKLAYEYIFQKRKFVKETVLEFKIGYSPDSQRELTDFLLKKGFKETELIAAGVSVRRTGLMDMFRGRIMIPLCDPFGKVIGFTARLLKNDDKAPKYINTPATVLYDKSRHVYGLHLAKRSIQAAETAVLVEGNLDVIASHQAGVKNVVATAGTALTDMQLKSLSRLATKVSLAFDQDKAGIAAAERAIPIASKTGIDLSIVTVPSGKDPDELINQDPKLWIEAIEASVPALDWLLSTYQQKLNLKTASGKKQFTDISLSIVRLLDDPVEQDHYLQKISELTQAHSESLRSKLKKVDDKQKPRLKPIKTTPAPEVTINLETTKAQSHFLGIMTMVPESRQYMDLISPKMFNNENAQILVEFLQSNLDFSDDVSQAEDLKLISDYVKILSLQFEELYGEIETTELQYEAARLRATVIDHFVKKQNQIIRRKLKDASQEESEALLAKVNKLNNLLRRTKE